jgi:fermentation-respiration switch protein FrsA (DUF1100 family)
MALSYLILVILMALRSSGGNGNELKDQLWSHKEKISGWLIQFDNCEAKECPCAGVGLLAVLRFSPSTAVPVLTAPSRGVPLLISAAPSSAVSVLTAAAPSTAVPMLTVAAPLQQIQ